MVELDQIKAARHTTGLTINAVSSTRTKSREKSCIQENAHALRKAILLNGTIPHRGKITSSCLSHGRGKLFYQRTFLEANDEEDSEDSSRRLLVIVRETQFVETQWQIGSH